MCVQTLQVWDQSKFDLKMMMIVSPSFFFGQINSFFSSFFITTNKKEEEIFWKKVQNNASHFFRVTAKFEFSNNKTYCVISLINMWVYCCCPIYLRNLNDYNLCDNCSKFKCPIGLYSLIRKKNTTILFWLSWNFLFLIACCSNLNWKN